MKWLSSLFSKSSVPDDERVERYKRLRRAGIALNMTLVKLLPKPAVEEGGKKLGIYKAGTLILNNDDEIAILYDYCLHHYLRAGKNVIERYLEQTPPPADSDEAILLRAMLDARYSIFRLEAINPKRGGMLRDLLTGAEIDLMDISLSETGSPGILLLGRVLPMGDFRMSSGTLIPLTETAFEQAIKPILAKYTQDNIPSPQARLSPTKEAAFVARLIRAALHAGGEDNAFYTDMESGA
jgi:hypothetical protein